MGSESVAVVVGAVSSLRTTTLKLWAVASWRTKKKQRSAHRRAALGSILACSVELKELGEREISVWGSSGQMSKTLEAWSSPAAKPEERQRENEGAETRQAKEKSGSNN